MCGCVWVCMQVHVLYMHVGINRVQCAAMYCNAVLQVMMQPCEYYAVL